VQDGKGKAMQDTTSGPSTQFTNIHTLANRFEADLLLDALNQEAIPAFLRTFEETAYDGLFVCQRGWGWLMVPEELSAQAIAIIAPLLENLKSSAGYVDPSEVDPLLWERLRKADPEVICRNAGVEYEPKLAAYVVPFLNAEYLCSVERQCIELLTGDSCTTPDFQFYLVFLHYLLEARREELSERWIGEKELQGGEVFFRGPHGLPLAPLVAIFGRQPNVFRLVAEKLGGMAVPMGDLAFQFPTFPRLPLLLVLWEGDDEFEPEMLMRFDSTISCHLERLDAIWALASVFSRSIEACAKSICGEETKDH
jgi:hypothetical protein